MHWSVTQRRARPILLRVERLWSSDTLSSESVGRRMVKFIHLNMDSSESTRGKKYWRLNNSPLLLKWPPPPPRLCAFMLLCLCIHWDQAATNPDPHPNFNQNSWRKRDMNVEKKIMESKADELLWVVCCQGWCWLVNYFGEASWGWSFLCCALICSPLAQMFHLPWSSTWSSLLHQF